MMVFCHFSHLPTTRWLMRGIYLCDSQYGRDMENLITAFTRV